MGWGTVPAPIGTSFDDKAPRIEAFFLEKLDFLPEPLRPHPNEDPNLKKILLRGGSGPAVTARHGGARHCATACLAAPDRLPVLFQSDSINPTPSREMVEIFSISSSGSDDGGGGSCTPLR